MWRKFLVFAVFLGKLASGFKACPGKDNSYMHFIRSIQVSLFFVLAIAACTSARAEEFRIPVYDSDDSFFVQVLHLALATEGGPHSIKTFEHPVTQSRTLRELQDGKFNIFYSGYSADRERDFIQVYIPLTRGMLGYRFLAIRENNAAIFQTIKSQADFRRLVTLGANSSWPDTGIMEAAGLEVIKAPSDALWTMLRRNRFLAFPRGMSEALPEIRREGTDAENPLMLEPHFMLAYRYDSFFYVPKNRPDLAAIVESGLRTAYENGSYMKLFDSHPVIQAAFEEIKARPRTVFWIDTPGMSERTRNIPMRYWLTPEETEGLTRAAE
jgi:hypothetical protein